MSEERDRTLIESAFSTLGRLSLGATREELMEAAKSAFDDLKHELKKSPSRREADDE